MMISKNYHITPEQNLAIKRLSKEFEKPEVVLVRKAIDDYIRKIDSKRKK